MPGKTIFERLKSKADEIDGILSKEKIFFNYITNLIPGPDSDLKKYAEMDQIMREIKFEHELRETPKDKIKELIDFHLRYYQRQGGKAIEFINKLRKINKAGLDKYQLDEFLSLIDAMEEKNSPIKISIALIGLHKDYRKSLNNENTSSPVFYHIKDVLKEFLISAKEAREILFDNKGAYSPQMNQNVIEPIINYLERLGTLPYIPEKIEFQNLSEKDIRRNTEEKFKFIAYLNQYELEGIKFDFHIEKDGIISAVRSDGSITLFRTSYANNKEVNQEMTERFFQRRWEDRKKLFIEPDFIHDELKTISEFSEIIKKEFEAQFYPLQKLLKEKLVQPTHKIFQSKKTSEYKTFEDLFASPEDSELSINILKQVEPPIINDNLKFQLGERQKGAIVAFVSVLKKRGKIIHVKDEELSKLLNKKIKGLNLSIDGRTLRNLNTTTYKKYYNTFLNLIT